MENYLGQVKQSLNKNRQNSLRNQYLKPQNKLKNATSQDISPQISKESPAVIPLPSEPASVPEKEVISESSVPESQPPLNEANSENITEESITTPTPKPHLNAPKIDILQPAKALMPNTIQKREFGSKPTVKTLPKKTDQLSEEPNETPKDPEE